MAAHDDEARILALPCWQGKPIVQPLHGGLSNANYLVQDEAGKHVVRFGQDYPFHHVFRDREVMVARAAHAAGFAPEVQHAAAGVMVSQFLGAKTYDAASVRENAPRIGSLLRAFHTCMAAGITGPGFMFWVFHVIRDYAHQLRAGGAAAAPDLDRWTAEASAMEQLQVPLPIVFAHNDLLPANFLDDGRKIWLIDFEYAGFNTALFDLAGTASNAQMPDEEAKALLHSYFGTAPDQALLRAFDAMQCASLLREALWSMVSGLHLSTPGVDYAAYGAENLARYLAALDTYQTRHGKLTS